jgi:hypothetical protein
MVACSIVVEVLRGHRTSGNHVYGHLYRRLRLFHASTRRCALHSDIYTVALPAVAPLHILTSSLPILSRVLISSLPILSLVLTSPSLARSLVRAFHFAGSMSAYLTIPSRALLDEKATLLISLGAIFVPLTTISLACRVWVRTRLLTCWSRDDWFMLLTQVNSSILQNKNTGSY